MDIFNRKEPIILFVGDLFFLAGALFLALTFRFGNFPSYEFFILHLTPFFILFLIWAGVFFVAGLYEKHTLLLKSRLPQTILKVQLANSALAVLFFYSIPYFGIAPKTILFIYLIISFVLVVFWRTIIVPHLGFRNREQALLIGSGEEMKELRDEVNNNTRYNLSFISFIDLDEIEGMDFDGEVLERIYTEGITSIVVDLHNPKVKPFLPKLYNLMFSSIKFVDMHKLYEDIFDRVPLSLLNYNWFMENISASSKVTYDTFKRIMDITISLILGIITLIIAPFVALAIKIQDQGPVFIRQERIGRGNKIIPVYKFRSMRAFKSDGGEWVKENDERITRVGSFLRKTRIDELPQLLSVLRGDMSLIGPRPDIIDLGVKLAKETPYYNIRNLIKPGLSGWAQIKQDVPPQSVEETHVRLSYDLYYLKNRSLLLDIKITFQTLRTLLSRSGK